MDESIKEEKNETADVIGVIDDVYQYGHGVLPGWHIDVVDDVVSMC